jgi:SAM-dependent methyltransferase
VREQRLVFGEVAELYDRARPGYSGAVVDDVLSYGGLEPRGLEPRALALEIGAGTGKATVAFAARDVAVHALEPDPSMAAVAARNCWRYPAVEVEVTSFEEWGLRTHAFDLVFSAQAWHWVRPEVRVMKARAALGEGGTLALLWHRVCWDDNDPLRAALDDCYRRWAPELHARQPGFPGLAPSGQEAHARDELLGSPGFDEVVVHDHPWTQSLDAAAYLDRLRTQSDHRLLPAGKLERLLGAVREVIEAHGGTVTVPHSTLVVLARRI